MTNILPKKIRKFGSKSQSTAKHSMFRILHQRCWWCWRHLEGLPPVSLAKSLDRTTGWIDLSRLYFCTFVLKVKFFSADMFLLLCKEVLRLHVRASGCSSAVPRVTRLMSSPPTTADWARPSASTAPRPTPPAEAPTPWKWSRRGARDQRPAVCRQQTTSLVTPVVGHTNTCSWHIPAKVGITIENSVSN